MNNYNKESQRAILTALTKLQRDIHNILERLNRLETSTNLLQQVRKSISLIFYKFFSFQREVAMFLELNVRPLSFKNI